MTPLRTAELRRRRGRERVSAKKDVRVLRLRYRVVIKKTEEGYAISCPGLPGCWSQGSSEREALENIKDAIRSYLETVEELTKDGEPRYVEVTRSYA